jgi:hypothetical protein
MPEAELVLRSSASDWIAVTSVRRVLCAAWLPFTESGTASALRRNALATSL